jgi:hypothetical protein
MANTRKKELTLLAGASALNAKSEFAGVNGYDLIGLQVVTSAALSGGQIVLKQTNDNSTYNGQIVATMDFPAPGGGTFNAVGFDGLNVGTVVYAEITTALVGGTITKAEIIMSARS